MSLQRADANKPTEPVLRYATGERIELGDLVFEPHNEPWVADHKVYGIVEEVCQPHSSTALAWGKPQGCISIAWSRGHATLMGSEIVLQPYEVFFIRRRQRFDKQIYRLRYAVERLFARLRVFAVPVRTLRQAGCQLRFLHWLVVTLKRRYTKRPPGRS